MLSSNPKTFPKTSPLKPHNWVKFWPLEARSWDKSLTHETCVLLWGLAPSSSEKLERRCGQEQLEQMHRHTQVKAYFFVWFFSLLVVPTLFVLLPLWLPLSSSFQLLPCLHLSWPYPFTSFLMFPFMSFLLLVSSPSCFSLTPFIPPTTKISMQEKLPHNHKLPIFQKTNYTILHKKKSHEDHKLCFPFTSS